MTLFRDTDAAAEFIATADSRNTSPEVMKAIAYFANTPEIAVTIWDSGGCMFGWGYLIDHIIIKATDDDRIHPADLHWGDRTLDQIMSDEDAS